MIYDVYRRLAIKPKERKLWIKYLLRPVSTRLSYLIRDVTFISPNLVTCLMLFLVFFSGFLGLIKHFKLMAILLLLTVILDAVDGELARYRNQVTKDGKMLDAVYHLATYPIIMLGIGISLNHWAGLFALCGAVCFIWSHMASTSRGRASVKRSWQYYAGQLDQDHNFIFFIALFVFSGILTYGWAALSFYTVTKFAYIFWRAKK